MVVKVTSDTFEQEILKSELPVLLDCYADWCGPCKMMGPVVEKMSEKYAGQLVVGKLNVDDNMETARAYRVRSIPYMAVFKNGEVANSLLGAGGEGALEDIIKSVL